MKLLNSNRKSVCHQRRTRPLSLQQHTPNGALCNARPQSLPSRSRVLPSTKTFSSQRQYHNHDHSSTFQSRLCTSTNFTSVKSPKLPLIHQQRFNIHYHSRSLSYNTQLISTQKKQNTFSRDMNTLFITSPHFKTTPTRGYRALLDRNIDRASCSTTISRFGSQPLHFLEQQKRMFSQPRESEKIKLKFDYLPSDFENIAHQIYNKGNQMMKELCEIPKKERNFKNTIQRLDDCYQELTLEASGLNFLGYVSPSEEIRQVALKITSDLDKYFIEMGMRQDVFDSVLEFQKERQAEIESLVGEEKRLYERTVLDFRRNGMYLPENERQELQKLKKEMVELSNEFQKNLNEENSKSFFTKEELSGMPETYLEGLEQNSEGKYQVTLKTPEFFPILQFCKVEATRKKIDFENGAKCKNENAPILEKILTLRKQEAKLLGYESHAELILQDRMAKDPETVNNFLRDIYLRIKDKGQQEINHLLTLKQKNVKATTGVVLNTWDWRYYDNLMLESLGVQHQTIKEYFPVDTVIRGLLDVYQTVLGLRFEKASVTEKIVWHEDVEQYAVRDAHTQTIIGHFYLDLYPRQGKYGHAAVFTLQTGCQTNQGRQCGVSAMVSNFTKPVKDRPSLLSFDEVHTFFHEFGHLMHSLCTTNKFARFAGTNTERDFVEAPSQMLENWCYQPEILEKLSGHYKRPDEKLPHHLLDQLIKTRNLNASIKNLRQLSFGTFDMKIHTQDISSLEQEWHTSMKEVGMFPPQSGTNGAASFGHIVGGYSAGYYGYLWAKVFSSDMFTLFQEKKGGVLDPVVGKRYRDLVLAPGGSQDATVSLRNFLGREPNAEAFFREILSE